jgi:hypothetical protein
MRAFGFHIEHETTGKCLVVKFLVKLHTLVPGTAVTTERGELA